MRISLRFRLKICIQSRALKAMREYKIRRESSVEKNRLNRWDKTSSLRRHPQVNRAQKANHVWVFMSREWMILANTEIKSLELVPNIQWTPTRSWLTIWYSQLSTRTRLEMLPRTKINLSPLFDIFLQACVPKSTLHHPCLRRSPSTHHLVTKLTGNINHWSEAPYILQHYLQLYIVSLFKTRLYSLPQWPMKSGEDRLAIDAMAKSCVVHDVQECKFATGVWKPKHLVSTVHFDRRNQSIAIRQNQDYKVFEVGQQPTLESHLVPHLMGATSKNIKFWKEGVALKNIAMVSSIICVLRYIAKTF